MLEAGRPISRQHQALATAQPGAFCTCKTLQVCTDVIIIISFLRILLFTRASEAYLMSRCPHSFLNDTLCVHSYTCAHQLPGVMCPL